MQSNSDPCIYIDTLDEIAVVGLYVDDIVFACKTKERLDKFKHELCSKFDVKILGKLRYFPGLKVVQDRTSGDVWLGQSRYVSSTLKKFGMLEARSVVTPVDTSTKLVAATDDDVPFDSSIYRSAIGRQLYLSTSTRPDISFAVSNVARFSSNPSKRNWIGV